MKTLEAGSSRESDAWFYLLAALCGIGTGWADVMINDLLFTALLVLAACILLGMLRPRWPWRWVVVVGVCIPLTEMAAYVILTVKPTRAQVYGSYLAFLPGIAGAYGGSIVRRVLDNLRQGKECGFRLPAFGCRLSALPAEFASSIHFSTRELPISDIRIAVIPRFHS